MNTENNIDNKAWKPRSGMEEWLIGYPGKPGPLKTSGLSVEQLARKSGYSRAQSIYYQLAGQKTPTRSSLERMCAALNVPMDEALQYVKPVEKVGRPRKQ